MARAGSFASPSEMLVKRREFFRTGLIFFFFLMLTHYISGGIVTTMLPSPREIALLKQPPLPTSTLSFLTSKNNKGHLQLGIIYTESNSFGALYGSSYPILAIALKQQITSKRARSCIFSMFIQPV